MGHRFNRVDLAFKMLIKRHAHGHGNYFIKLMYIDRGVFVNGQKSRVFVISLFN